MLEREEPVCKGRHLRLESLGLGGLLLLLQHAQADADAAAVAPKGEALEGLCCMLPRHQAVVLRAHGLPVSDTQLAAGLRPASATAQRSVQQ